MRTTYVVTYDISDDKRRRRVFRILLGHGDHLQYSVFRCNLTKMDLVHLRSQLAEVISHKQDQVMFVDVGPSTGRAGSSFEAIGRSYSYQEKRAIIV